MPSTADTPRPPPPTLKTPLSAYDFDTTPGAHSALAPPADFAGGQDDYLEVIRRRYHQDHEARQCILVAALRHSRPFGDRTLRFRGPYADWARQVIATAAATFKQPPTQD